MSSSGLLTSNYYRLAYEQILCHNEKVYFTNFTIQEVNSAVPGRCRNCSNKQRSYANCELAGRSFPMITSHAALVSSFTNVFEQAKAFETLISIQTCLPERNPWTSPAPPSHTPQAPIDVSLKYPGRRLSTTSTLTLTKSMLYGEEWIADTKPWRWRQAGFWRRLPGWRKLTIIWLASTSLVAHGSVTRGRCYSDKRMSSKISRLTCCATRWPPRNEITSKR